MHRATLGSIATSVVYFIQNASHWLFQLNFEVILFMLCVAIDYTEVPIDFLFVNKYTKTIKLSIQSIFSEQLLFYRLVVSPLISSSGQDVISFFNRNIVPWETEENRYLSCIFETLAVVNSFLHFLRN